MYTAILLLVPLALNIAALEVACCRLLEVTLILPLFQLLCSKATLRELVIDV